jgi:membrane associated rhomboid family serine protease
VLPVRDHNPTHHRPVVTVLLMVACAVAYFLWQPTPFAGTADDVEFDLRHAAIPLEVRQGHALDRCQVFRLARDPRAEAVCRSSSADEAYAGAKNPYLAVVVSLFLHGSIVHLGGNLLFLWIFGNNVEDRLGAARYLIFYLVAGVVATGAHILVDTGSTSTLVGASGAIAGVMGAYLVWFPRVRITTAIFFVIWVRLRAWVLLAAWLVLQFFTDSSSNVAWVAHVGGFLFGVVVGLLLRERVQPPPEPTLLAPWPPPPPWR